MMPIIMSGYEIDGESLSLSVSADRSVFDVEIPQKTRVSDDSAAEMRFDSGDMDGRVSGSGGLSAVESEGTRVLEGEMVLDGGDGDFEVGKSEMECDEVEVGGSTVKAEGLGFNDGNGSFGGGNGGIGHLVVRSEEGSGSVSSGCGYGEIKRKTEIDDRGDDNLFDEMECKVVRSEEVDVAELRQKMQNMETLQKEVELLQRQKAASEQAALKQKQSSGGVWGWLAGAPPSQRDDI